MPLGSQELIREMNSRLILETIVNDGPISRAALSARLGLTKATVSSIVQSLLSEQLIQETGIMDTSVGRKPVMLTFWQQCGWVISVDLSMDHVIVLSSDLKGEHCLLTEYPNTWSRDDVIDGLEGILRRSMESLPDTPHGLIGVCIGIHGIIDEDRIVFTPYYDLADLPIAPELSSRLGVPVYLENEANLAVLGEKVFCYGCSNMVNLSIHSGLGLGIIIAGQLYHGFHGFAGEFGHTIVVPNGRPCPCGNRGCLEQYASEYHLLTDFARSKGEAQRDIDRFVRAYAARDPDAIAIADRFTDFMAVALNNIVNNFSPELIVINSSLISFIPNLLPQITDKWTSRRKDHCLVVPSTLQDTAILLGGVSVCTREFLHISRLDFQ